jgi:hypothetical protein
MANPKPVQTPEFLAQQKPKYGEKPLGNTIAVRFSAEVDSILRQRSDRQQIIRAAVELYLREKGLL